MTVPEHILVRLRELDQPLIEIRQVISLIYELRSAEREALDPVIDQLEQAVDAWLDRTREIEFGPEDALVNFVPPVDEVIARLDDYLGRVAEGDAPDDIEEALRALRESNALRADGTAADALGRLCGLSLLHNAIACDVGSLSDFDGLAPGERLTYAPGLPAAPPTTIFDTAYGAGLLESLGSDLALLISHEHVHHEFPESAEVQAMGQILDRARDVTKAILSGAAPSGALFSHVKPALNAAAAVAPAELRRALRSAVGRITAIVGKLLRRVGQVIDHVSSSYSSTISRFISKWVEYGKDHLVDEAIRAVLGRVFGVSDLRHRIEDAYAGGGQRLSGPHRKEALEDLLKQNRRWVGPAGTAAKGLHFLWPVHAGPVPTAPIAACALLAWTLIITGDQLDARGPFPQFWAGVGTIATR